MECFFKSLYYFDVTLMVALAIAAVVVAAIVFFLYKKMSYPEILVRTLFICSVAYPPLYAVFLLYTIIANVKWNKYIIWASFALFTLLMLLNLYDCMKWANVETSTTPIKNVEIQREKTREDPLPPPAIKNPEVPTQNTTEQIRTPAIPSVPAAPSVPATSTQKVDVPPRRLEVPPRKRVPVTPDGNVIVEPANYYFDKDAK